MSDEDKLKIVTLSQIAEALEERQTPDRRKKNGGVPEEVSADRRKVDRRNLKVGEK